MAWPRKNLLAGSIIALILLSVPAYFSWRFLSIAWHRYEMRAAYGQIARVEGAGNDYEKHRAALIELGYFVKHQFYLKRITTDSTEFNELLNNLELRFPTQIGKLEAHGYIYGEPTFVVAWIHSTEVKEIGDFIRQADENEPAAEASSK